MRRANKDTSDPGPSKGLCAHCTNIKISQFPEVILSSGLALELNCYISHSFKLALAFGPAKSDQLDH